MFDLFKNRRKKAQYEEKNESPVTTPSDPLLVIKEKEQLRYAVAEKWDTLEVGQEFRLEDVFGDSYEDNQVNAFWEVLALVNSQFLPITIPTEEELDSPQYEGAGGRLRLLNRLGDYFLLVRRDAVNGLRYFESAAREGSGYAYARIGGYHFHELNDVDKGIEYYLKAILLDGDANALMDLALCYLEGNGVSKDYLRARELMLRSAKQGNPMARYNMGWFSVSFEFAKFDYDEAIQWYRLSAKDYYEQALFALYNLLGNTEDNLALAKRFAEYGYPVGLYYYGKSYLEGDLVECDLEKGFQMIKEAADKGYPDAARICSDCYESGLGTTASQKMSDYYSSLVDRIMGSDSLYAEWKKPHMYIKE